MTDKINLLGKNIRIEFSNVGPDQQSEILSDLAVMVRLINQTIWPPEYADAYRLMDKIIFFSGEVEVNTHLMSRSCCDEDDRIFYWEVDNEFLLNRDADVHGHTLFHDCWHIVQYIRDDGFARQRHVQIAREIEATNHQIKVAQLLGCDDREIDFLKNFRDDQSVILVRLEEGVHIRLPKAAGDKGLA
ncbi:MAG: hypothetical protein R3E04_03455 [Sphingobium sp.]